MHPLLPFDLFEATFLVEGFKSGMSTSELLALHIRQIQKHDSDIEKAAEMLHKLRLRSKRQFNIRYQKRLQKSEYKEGSLVLVRNTRLEMTLNKFKLDPRYLGPYEVVQQTAGGNYILKELDGTVHMEPYAAFRLISYVTRDDPILYEDIEENPYIEPDDQPDPDFLNHRGHKIEFDDYEETSEDGSESESSLGSDQRSD
jgi:hypothetical protein